MKKLIILFALASTLWYCAAPQYLIEREQGWELLGFEKVNHLREKDVFVPVNQDKFTALRFYVKERDVEIKEVKITLINGDVLQPKMELRIKRDERSRVIELGAEGRQVERVEIHYKSTGKLLSKKGIVLLVARPYDPNGKY